MPQGENCFNMNRHSLVLWTLLLASAAFSQTESGSAALNGLVSDPAGKSVAAAAVELRNTDTGYTRKVTTADDGRFIAPVLPVGAYQVRVVAAGFADARVDSFKLEVGEAKSITIRLNVSSVREQVTVVAEAAELNTDRSATASSIGSAEIEALPIRGRNFTEFAQLTPGVMQESDRSGLVFAGQRSINSNIAIDGADFNDPLQGNQRGGNQAVFFFPQSAVREFQVVRSGATAEVGRTGAGFVNVVTRSGTNDTHGDLFYFLRNKKLTSPDAFGRKLNNRQNQFGGSVGGALRKDRAFFFAALEQNLLRVPFVVKFQQQAAGVVVPADIAALEGEQRGTNNPTALFIRQDTNLTSKHALNLGYTFSRMRGENFNFDSPQLDQAASANYMYRGNSHAGKVGLVSVLSPTMINELKGQIATDDRLEDPNSNLAQIVITGFGTLGSDTGRPRRFDARRYQLADNFTWTQGIHSLRIGTDLNINKMNQERESNIQGRYDYSNLANYIAGRINRYRQTLPGFRPEDLIFRGKQQELAFFVNDSMKLRRKLTMNWGVRWEGQWNPTPPRPNPAIPQTAVIPDDLNMWQPRLGLAWTPGKNGNTVIRLSAGLFSARTPANLFQRVFTDNGITTVAVDSRTDASILTLLQFPKPLTSLPANLLVPVPRVFGFVDNFSNPQSAQFSGTVEQQLGQGMMISVGYIRNSTWRLQRRLDRNLFTPTYNAAGTPIYPTTRPNKTIGVLSVNESSAHSSYDGLVLTAKKRFSHSFQMQANYTYSATWDDDSNERNFSREPTFHITNLQLERAYSKQDIRHNFNVNALVKIKYGFALSGTLFARTGVPWTQTIGSDQQNDANDDNDLAVINGVVAKRNAMRQPNFLDLGLRVQKAIRFADRKELVISADGFNVTKSPNRHFGSDAISNYGAGAVPNATAGQPLFAPSTARFGGPRQLQLGARLVF
jgi:hypothetical protein